MKLVSISKKLAQEVEKLTFASPVAYTYNPLEYAWEPHREYLEKFGKGRKEVVLVGMNPGPFGMAQTGVPFGDVEMVRSWLGIERKVARPKVEHPKREVLGFDCPRSEVSGSRLWGWARERFGTAPKFFKRFFVWNYCPLCFMEESSRNRTPDKLSAPERELLFDCCNKALVDMVQTLRPSHVIGIGKFAERRIREILPPADFAIGSVLHPSPASPKANRGWAKEAERDLSNLGIEIP